MAIKNNQKQRYSYFCHDSRNSYFLNKNFNKTNSFKTNFSNSKFSNCGLVSAKFKFCSFYNVIFDNCYIRGALFKKCNLINTNFRNCIVSSSVFERSKLNNCQFIDCIVLDKNQLLDSCQFCNTERLSCFPYEKQFDSRLLREVRTLRENFFIRRSTILHRKKGKLETVSIKYLCRVFGESFLIQNISKLSTLITKEFYSLSYIITMLNKIRS